MVATLQTNGWSARLALGFEARGERTVLAHREHHGPLAVQKPFYPEQAACHVYLLHPPGGVVGGDHLSVQVKVADGAHALITTPASTKFYRSGGEFAVQEQCLDVAPHGILEWLPQDTILFASSRVATTTRINLTPGARFIGWEILCLGRPAAGELFNDGVCRQRFELWSDDTPLLIERANLIGGSRILEAAWGFGGQTVYGCLVATPATKPMLELVREDVQAAGDGLFSATLIEDTLVCRYLGDSAEDTRQSFASAWSVIRPNMLGLTACPPRVWST